MSQILERVGAQSATGRTISVDIARALAVIIVVAHHSVDSLVDTNSLLANISDFSYFFDLTTIAFILGTFIPGAVKKRGLREYMSARAGNALYLYLLWFAIQSLALVFTQGLFDQSGKLDSLLNAAIPPGRLWFLPFFALVSVVIPVVAAWKLGARHKVALLGLGVLSVLTWNWDSIYIGTQGWPLIFFAAVGSAVGLGRASKIFEYRWTIWVPVGALASSLFALVGPLANELNADGPQVVLVGSLSLISGILGVILVMLCAKVVSSLGIFARYFAKIGTMTLPIYLLHNSILVGVREVMLRLGLRDATAVLIVSVAAGVLGSFFLSVAAKKVGLKWLFDQPRWLRTLTARLVTPSALNGQKSTSAV